MMVHLGISGITKTPEMALEQPEADLLAEATVNVLREFDIQPDPRAEAIIGLIVAAGTVYGPRVYLIKHRKQTEAKTGTQKYDPETEPHKGPQMDIPVMPTMSPGSSNQI